jgi:hypothetical protein
MNTTRTPAELLTVLNSYRFIDGKPALTDWRNARHMPMLEKYEADYQAKYEAEQAALVAKTAEINATVEEKAKLPAYKVLARMSGSTSTVAKPVEIVHSFCDQNAHLSRKEAVAALVEMGINYSTARTQYQKWFTARKG